MRRTPRTLALSVAAACTLVVGLAGTATAQGTNPLQPDAQLYVDPTSSTVQAAASLTGTDQQNALLLAQYPSATWFTGGTPQEVAADAAALVAAAKAAGQVPVIVAYNLPNRDCGQYSAGGAANLSAYEAWIAGLTTGIGDGPAVVILEPDGLGLIPNYLDPDQTAGNCTIAGVDPADRFAALNYAVDTLKTGANTAVYLDATHSGWQNVGAASQRLLKAGVQRADGFFLNASNYQFTVNQVAYGTWISDCIALAEAASPEDPASWDAPANCPNQYWDGGPATNWQGAALSGLSEWSSVPFADPANPTADEIASLTWNTVGIDSNYAAKLGTDVVATTHFVIDTSRNGQGPWDWASAGYPDSGTAQDWCNPPGRGVGIAPTTDTGIPLVDAYLWLKVPGESDGQCSRGSSDGTDPEWGDTMDPAAGAWFPAQAAQLIADADPVLTKTVPTIPSGPSEPTPDSTSPGTTSPPGTAPINTNGLPRAATDVV